MSHIFTAYSFDNEEQGLDPLHGLGRPITGIAGRVREMWEAKVDTPEEFQKLVLWINDNYGWYFDNQVALIDDLSTAEEYQDNEFDLVDNDGRYGVGFGISIEGSPDYIPNTVDDQLEWLRSLPPRRATT